MIKRLLFAAAAAIAIFLLGLWSYTGFYGLNVLFRHGGVVWLPVGRDSSLLSSSMRMALAEPAPAIAGPFQWRTIAPGFEVADMPVRAKAMVVDRLYLARIDPARYRFELRNAASGENNLDAWMRQLRPALVVNASYYAHDGRPATPFLSRGRLLGPHPYSAKAGAFVATPAFTGIRDLSRQDWRKAFQGAHDAIVSYPMLLAGDQTRVTTRSEWLANRSFVGQDSKGRIIIGTTTDAWFSLARLAEFLQSAPLDLQYALNLDGGPVACQGIDLAGYRRKTYGQWEAQVQGERVRLLHRPYGGPDQMPVVLAVFPK